MSLAAPDLAGHEEAWRTWRAALAGERMHHGWILAGPRGIGKASFAAAAAAELVAEPGRPAPAAHSHPDILILAPAPDSEEEERKRAEGKPFKVKRNITVAQVRAMQRRLTTRPTLGARRAVIVDAADDMEAGAFNALLKTLEEPAEGTFLMLVAHRPGRLPATIRSRCRLLRFTGLSDAVLRPLVAGVGEGAGREAEAAALAIAAGSPGAALDFLARELGRVHALMVRIARHGDPDLALRGALLEEVGPRPDRDRLLAVIDAARRVLVAEVAAAPRARQARIIEAHAALARLLAEAPTYNFEASALVFEIGGLLASAGDPRDAAA